MARLEHIICFFIEEKGVKKILELRERTFDGFLRDQVQAVYNSLTDPYRKIGFCAEKFAGLAAELDFKYSDEKGKMVFDLRTILSSGAPFLGLSEENWPGRIYTGIDYESSNFTQYEGGETREFGTLPVQGFSLRMAQHLLKHEIPFSVRPFRDETELLERIKRMYR